MNYSKIILSTMLISFSGNFSYAQKIKSASQNIAQIYNYYLEIKNALIKNDGTTAKIKANELHYFLTTQPDKGLNWRQCKILGDNLEPLIESSHAIGLTIVENEQRAYFSSLSKGLYGLLKGLKMNTSKIYMQYSPRNHAYWLSETQQ